MSYSGHNITASTGAFVPPSIDETEATAAKTLPAAELNRMRNSDEIYFGEMGKYERWKYPSSAPRPSLPPLQQMRVRSEKNERHESREWEAKYEELLNKLPPNLRAVLLHAMHNKDSNLAALDGGLKGAAQLISWVDVETPSWEFNSGKVQQNETNRLLPDIVLAGVKEVGSESLAFLKDAAALIGPNDLDYDTISYYIGVTEKGFNRL